MTHRPILSLFSEKYLSVFFALVLITVILGAYGSVGSHKPIYFDDGLYYTNNYYVQQGLSWGTVAWAWTNIDAANWHPITWLSHLVDKQFFDKWLGPIMFQNVLWHMVNSFLVCALLGRLLKDRWLGFILALVFALHPQNVESVAWLSQRKSQLAMFFLLSSLLLYFEGREKGARRQLVFSAIAFFMSLASKPMGVTLPALLALWEFKQGCSEIGTRRALSNEGWKYAAYLNAALLAVKRTGLFWLIAVAVALITFMAQDKAGAVASTDTIALSLRLSNSLRAIQFYLVNFISPGDQAFFYIYRIDPTWERSLYGAFLILCLLAVCLIKNRYQSVIQLGIAWFFLFHLPTIGFVQVGSQSYADRYMYLPMVGLLLSLGALLLVGRDVFGGKFKFYAQLGLLSFSLGLGAKTYAYLVYWTDPEAAYHQSIKVGGESVTMLMNLGAELWDQNRPKSALPFLNRAYVLDPGNTKSILNLGLVHGGLGNYDASDYYLSLLVQMEPGNAKNLYNLAFLRSLQGRTDEAGELYVRAKALLEKRPSWDILESVMRDRLSNIEGFLKQTTALHATTAAKEPVGEAPRTKE